MPNHEAGKKKNSDEAIQMDIQVRNNNKYKKTLLTLQAVSF